MKKIIAVFMAITLLVTAFSYEPLVSKAEDPAPAETVIEAEEGRILFGKLTEDENASGKYFVKLGEDKPAGENSGVYWYVNANAACTTTITVEYSTGSAAVAYFYCNNVPLPNVASPEALPASANGEKLTKTYDISLNAGVNEIVVLCFNDIISIDKITLHTTGVNLIKNSPIVESAENDIKHYYAHDAGIHMGQPAPNAGAISQNCVINTQLAGGYLNYDNIYSETGGLYQVIVYCAANAGSNVKVSVNGQEYITPVLLPLGWGTFVDGTGARSHAVITCNLMQGNNQIQISCSDNDVCIDMIRVARLDTYARYEAEAATLAGTATPIADGSVSGTGFVAGLNDVNSEVTFKVNVAEEGTYSLCARYYASEALPGATAEAPTMRVYTQAGYYGEISFVKDASTWQVAVMEISLKAGENQITLRNGNGNTYIDYIGISGKTGSYQVPVEDRDGIAIEAENMQILFGKLMNETGLSGNGAVKIGEDVPEGAASGIIGTISITEAKNVPITLHYTASADAVLNVVSIDAAGTVVIQTVKLSGNKTTECLDMDLSQGNNTIQILYGYGAAVVMDKVEFHGTNAALVKASPNVVDAANDITFYYASDAKIHMGQSAGNPGAVSQSCVINMKLTDGYLDFDNIYSENGGYYQIILFGAADAGSNVKININGQEHIAPVLSPLGWGTFVDAAGTRSHAVVYANLEPGNNRIMASCPDNDVCVDMLQVALLDPMVRYEAEDASYDTPVTSVADPTVSGTGFVAGLNDPSSEVTFRVNVEEDGQYKISFRYYASEDMHSAVDGTPSYRIFTQDGYCGEVELVKDGSTWQIAELELSLKAGINKIIFRNGNGNAYLDYLGIGAKTGTYEENTDTENRSSIEAEDMQILLGKIKKDTALSNGIAVLLGEDTPTGMTSGLVANISSDKKQTASLTLHYSAAGDAVVNVVVVNSAETVVQAVRFSSEKNSEIIDVALGEGANTVQVLFASGQAVSMDKLTFDKENILHVTEEPVKATDVDTIYYSRNGRIHMGTIGAGENSVSGTCVSALVHESGNGYIEFNNVYSEKDGYYQLIVFTAADEGSKIKVTVNGQEYIATVTAALGKNVFANADDVRSHGVVMCKLNAGNNQVIVSTAENADVQIDALMTSFQSDKTRYEAEDAKLQDVLKKGSNQEYDYGTYSGTGFVGNIDTGSSEVSFTVNVDEAGEYEIGICYANGTNDVTPTYRVYTQEGYYGEVSMSKVTGWGNFSRDTVAIMKISLQKGENRIRIKKGQHNAELDYIEIGTKCGSYKQPLDGAEGFEMEAEKGQLVFGKVLSDAVYSNGQAVTIGDHVPQGSNSGIFWNAMATKADRICVTIEYTASENTDVLFFNNDILQETLSLAADKHRESFHISAIEELNRLALLYASGTKVIIDKIVLYSDDITAYYEEPIHGENGIVIYPSRNALVHMANIVAAENSVSGTCVSQMIHEDGNGYIEYNNIYAEEGGQYQIIVFVAADAGNSIRVIVNGEEFEVPIYLAMGQNVFANESDARSHVVINCALEEGNNQIVIQPIDDVEIQVDAVMVSAAEETKDDSQTGDLEFDVTTEDEFKKIEDVEEEEPENFMVPIIIIICVIVVCIIGIGIVAVVKKRKEDGSNEKK